MQTITFYSYKGGVGRTLFVANVARYLARLGQKIFVIDFDLEAPGLHYKFNLEKQNAHEQVSQGVVDYIYTFFTEGKIPETLKDYVIEIARREDKGGTIHLMPAGNAPSKKYWHRLAQIDWHDLFYSERAKGIPFFLELKERINKEFSPDFLLIDSRTGITEVGGVATSLLPDKVVCILLNNQENLEGAREVLRSIKRAPRLQDQVPVEVLPVVARIPKLEHTAIEENVINQVRDYLNEEAPNLSDTLNFSEIFVLHSEPELQITESLRVGGNKSPAESLLLRDYLRLFSRLIPREKIQPHIGPLIEEAIKKAIDDPDGAQQDLEALTTSYPHFETYQALLKFYRLRNADSKKLLGIAEQCWGVTGSTTDPLVWQVVKDGFVGPASFLGARASNQPSLEFIEAIWNGAGGNDVKVGLLLAQAYGVGPQRLEGLKVLRRMLENNEVNPEIVVEYINQLRRNRGLGPALEVVNKYKSALASNPAFQIAWAESLLSVASVEELENALALEDFSLDIIISKAPLVAVRLLQRLGRVEEADVTLHNSLNKALREGNSREIAEVGEIFDSLGRRSEFEELVRAVYGNEPTKDILRLLPRRRMSTRYA